MITVQSSYKAMLLIAYKCVESSSLYIGEGALYTERQMAHWSEHGATLEVKTPANRYAKYLEAQRA